MKILLLSDLHREISLWNPTPLDVDLVILAGDISAKLFGVTWALQAFKNSDGSRPQVVYVAGNHEFYHAHLGLLGEMLALCKADTHMHVLEQGQVTLSDVRVLGCTLWSNFALYGADRVAGVMDTAAREINDFQLIQNIPGKLFTPEDSVRLYEQSAAWLDQALAEPFAGKTVVVTHFAPHRRCVASRYEGSDLSAYFVNDLEWLMEKYPIDLWCYGHTHTNADFVAANGCRVISNQRGYPSETDQMKFRQDFMIEI
jgi:predicted phosphodiesterase